MNLSENTYLSSGYFNCSSLSGITRDASRLGVFNLELGSGVVVDSKKAGSDEFNYLVHNFVSSKSCSMVLNISDPDSLNRIESIKFCKRAIDLCLALGSPFYSVHSGFCAALESADLGHPERIKNKICEANVRPRSYFLDLMLNSLEILSDYAAQKGIRLVFENNVLAHANWDINPLLCCDPAETREILDSLNHSVGLLLDVGHAKVSGVTLEFSPENFFDVCGDYIEYLHLSENDGFRDTNWAFNEEAWFIPYLGSLNTPKVLEVYRQNGGLDGLQTMIGLVNESS